MSQYAEWQQQSVSELCLAVTSGGTPNRAHPEYYDPGTIPWVKTGDLNDAYIEEYSEFISAAGMANSSAKLLPAETVLMAMYGATVGKLGHLREPASCNQAACAMITKPEVCDARWLFYALLNDREKIVSQANGAAQQNLSGTTIKKLQFVVPHVAAQRAIAEVLGALDDKIAANTKHARTIEELGAAKFRALGVDAEPVAGAITVDKLFEFNARYSTTSDVATLIDMQGLPTSQPMVANWMTGPRKGGARFRNGDTLLARITPCLENRKTGFVDFLDDEEVGIGSTEFVIVRSRVDIPLGASYFLATSKRFREFAIQNMVGTSGRQRVAAADMARFELNPVEESCLVDFGSWADAVLRHLGSLRDENQTLAATRDALLPHLMSGKLRVKDVEKLVSAAV